MSNLTTLAFEGYQVRCVGTLEQPEWLAADVCNVLSLNTSEAVNGHKRKAADGAVIYQGGLDEDEKGMVIVHTPGGEQEMLTVTEPGLYRLLSKSRKPIAKRFQRWVFHEVLPSIRQTGSYALPHSELELKKLELQLIQAKQRYQDTGYAIQLSTSAAVLMWLRGESPPPARVEYKERFIDSRTGKEVGSNDGRSLTQLLIDAGLNPKSKRDRNWVKRILKSSGFDYDRMQRWSTASHLQQYPVLKDEVYDQALKAVLEEVLAAEGAQPNLFVEQMQQATLGAARATQLLRAEE